MAQAAGPVSEYQLPPGPSSSGAPAPAGPVDPEVPVIRSTRAPATDAAQPSPHPSAPVITLPVPESPAAVPAARPERSGRAQPTRRPAEAAVPAETPPSEPSPDLPPSPTPEPVAAPSGPIPAEKAADRDSSLPWPSVLASLGALLALGGLAWLARRRKTAGAEPDASLPARHPEPPVLQPEAPVALPERPTPAPSAPRPIPAPSFGPASPFALTLEITGFNRTLVYATLSYRLTVANASGASTEALRVAADLASAHASLSAAEQLGPDGAFQAHHDIAALPPGESASVTGSLRLPLSAVRAIRQGPALLFVPLVRVRIEPGGGSPALVRVFVVGEPGHDAGAALRPFRLDAMPGAARHVSQREIPLDAVAGTG